MSSDMLILVGLGNPGAKYARHRHNVGFMAVDALADAQGFGPAKTKFHGEVREGFLSGADGRRRAVTLKPNTFMNDSGRAVQAAAQFYKVEPGDIVVFHDELDLAAGKVKVKTGGGHAGHNGLRSIDAHIGADFRRVRIGIGHPGDKARVTGHVLGDFAKADDEWLSTLLGAMAAAAAMLTQSDARFTTELARLLEPTRTEIKKEPSLPAPRKIEQDHKSGARNAFADALKSAFGRKKD